MHQNSSVSEQLKGASDYSADKTHSHSEMVNVDPGNKAEKNMLESQDATDCMAVEETLEKSCHALETKNAMPLCGADATATTSNTVEQTDDDSRAEPNATEVVTNKAAYAAETDPATEHGQEQEDSEQMVIETDSSTGEGRIDIDVSKIDPAKSTDAHMPTGAEFTETNVPDEAGINIADGRASAVASTLPGSDDNADYLREDTDTNK